MIPYVRREKMINTIKNSKISYVNELQKIFNDISESTLRRDLNELERDGKITLLHGGGIKYNEGHKDIPFQEKNMLNIKEKDLIAFCAAKKIEDNDYIYIDSGTTCSSITKFIKATNVTIITSNIQLLCNASTINSKVISLGGEVNNNQSSLRGVLTNDTMKMMYFDKAFIGASGFDLENGITTFDLDEAQKKQLALKNAKESFFLLDATKKDKTFFIKICDIKDALIITDASDNKFKEVENMIIAE